MDRTIGPKNQTNAPAIHPPSHSGRLDCPASPGRSAVGRLNKYMKCRADQYNGLNHAALALCEQQELFEFCHSVCPGNVVCGLVVLIRSVEHGLVLLSVAYHDCVALDVVSHLCVAEIVRAHV